MSGKMSSKFVVLCTLAVGAIYASGYSISASAQTSPASSNQTAFGSPANTAVSQSGSGGSQTSGGSQGATSTGNHSANSSTSTSHNQSASTSSSTKTNTSNTSTSHTNTTSGSRSSGSGTSQTTTSHTATTTKSGSSSSSSKTSSTSAPPKPTVDTTDRYLAGTYTGSASNRIGTVEVAVTVKSGKIADVQITGCYTHYPQSYIDPVLPEYVVAHQTTQIPVVSGATLSSEDFYYAVTQALSKATNPHYKG